MTFTPSLKTRERRGAPRRVVDFIANDPKARGMLPRKEAPLPTPGRSAGVAVRPLTAPGVARGEQARLAAQALQSLRYGLQTFAAVHGERLAGWHAAIGTTLPVSLDERVELNAYYSRKGLGFCYDEVGGQLVFTCESQDVVCHEQGHAILDALRPDLFDAPFAEVAAFHEAFADCMALLTAVRDERVLERCLASGGPSGHTLVCDLAESLGLALVRRLRDPAMMDGSLSRPALRCANNHLEYVPPSRLGDSSALTALSQQCHNFSRVFTGAFYSSLLAVYAQGPRGKLGLLAAAQLVGALLVVAVRRVPLVPGIYHEVGRRMVQADIEHHGGAHAQAVDRAFAEHGMPLGAPMASLPTPTRARTRAEALDWVGATLGAKAAIVAELALPRAAGAAKLVHVLAQRPLELSTVSPALAGVYVLVPGSARLELDGEEVKALRGEPRPAGSHEDEEAAAYVRHLCARGAIAAEESSNLRLGATRIPRSLPTHAVREVDGRRTLVRLRFA